VPNNPFQWPNETAAGFESFERAMNRGTKEDTLGVTQGGSSKRGGQKGASVAAKDTNLYKNAGGKVAR
jgi:hypothetical protein